MTVMHVQPQHDADVSHVNVTLQKGEVMCENQPFSVAREQPVVHDAKFQVDELARFRALAAAVCSSICVSIIFCFGLLSDHLQNNYNYDQRDLTTISTVGLVVGFFTFPFGVMYDFTGVLPLFVLGTILTALGPILFAVTFDGGVAPSVFLLSLYNAILNLGCGLFDVGAVLVLMDVFPRNRGSAIGLVKTMTGLGSSVLAATYDGFFRGDSTNYMYFLVALALSFGFIVCYCIRMPPYTITTYEVSRICSAEIKKRLTAKQAYLTKKPPTFRIVFAYFVIIALLLLLSVTSIVGAYVELSEHVRLARAVLSVLIVLSFFGMAAPLKCMGGMEENSKGQPHQTLETEEGSSPVVVDASKRLPSSSYPPFPANVDVQDSEMFNMDPQYQTSFWKGLLTIDSWCVFWCSFWAWGAGLVVVLNVSQIYQGFDAFADGKTVSLLVALNGVGSAVGRLAIGAVESYLSRKRMTFEVERGGISSEVRAPVPLTIAYPGGCFLLLLGYVLFLILPPKAMIIAFLLTSCGYGYNAACTAVIVRTMWLRDTGKYYNLCFLGAMASCIVLNRLLFGELYDREATRNGTYPKCVGRGCVQTTFIVMIFGCATSVLASVVVHFRFSRFLRISRKEAMLAK